MKTISSLGIAAILFTIGIIIIFVGQRYNFIPEVKSILPPPTYRSTQPYTAPQVRVPDETTAIAAAVKAGGASSVTVLSVVGNYAEGAASGRGGGMWLAAKVSGAWRLIWNGGGNVPCATVNQYNFPSSLIHNCWDDADKKVITR
jgi:hypothetical protein